jgi:thymidine phosphorylase
VDSPIDPAVGVILHRKAGDAVAEGEPLCTLFANDEAVLRGVAAPMVADAYDIGDEAIAVPPLIFGRI